MNGITFNIASAGLGRPLPGQDYVSGMVLYTAAGATPSGFTVSNIQEVFQISDLETLGVTASNNDYGVLHYNTSEFFRMQPGGTLYIGIYGTAGVGTYNELTSVQSFAGGSIRQMGVIDSVTTFNTGNVTALQTVATTNFTNKKPFQIAYQPNFYGLTLSALTDLHTLSAKNVMVCLGQDGAGVGAALYTATNKTVGCLGTTLGALALANVNESIAWVGKFNADNGTEFDTLAFANGQAYNLQSDGLLAQLDARGYVFLKKQIGIVGSYWNNPYTATVATSDFAFMFAGRTMDKATRAIYINMIPALASPIQMNADGTLNQDAISYFESLCSSALDVMVRNFEISAYKLTMNPAQNVLSTSKLVIGVSIVPYGTANNIEIDLGFVPSI